MIYVHSPLNQLIELDKSNFDDSVKYSLLWVSILTTDLELLLSDC